jgi:RNA polymerase sigma-70 factor, ECF subfamily
VAEPNSLVIAVQSPAKNGTADESAAEELVVQLFHQFRGPLLRYLYTFGLKCADCEEIIQEVFLALFQHLTRNKSRANLPGWIFRVAHNLGLKHRRKLQRWSVLHLQEDFQAAVPDPCLTPESQSIANQTRRRALAVLDALPEQDRRCVLLKAEGFRYREIAKIVGVSLGSVSLSLTRSLARIARASHR